MCRIVPTEPIEPFERTIKTRSLISNKKKEPLSRFLFFVIIPKQERWCLCIFQR